MVHRAVEAVLDTADFAIALTGADVASCRATVANARGKLHVPLAVVTLGVGLVGEYAGRADLDQVAGELAFQHAVFDTTEVHVVMGAVDAQIGAAGVILVIAHAAVAGDAAVHLVSDERAEFLVGVGALGEAITALVVTGHHGHVLQVAVATFLAHRAVVRVVGHQPFHHAFAELLGFLVVDGNPGVVRGGCHARHDQAAALVVLVGVLLDRALAAGTNAAQRRMPAEVRNIKSHGEAGLQQVVRPIDFKGLAVYVNSGHFRVSSCTRQASCLIEKPLCPQGGRTAGHACGHCIHAGTAAACLAIPASNSGRKYFNALPSGSTAPGACAQKVRPGPSEVTSISSVSRSPA